MSGNALDGCTGACSRCHGQTVPAMMNHPIVVNVVAVLKAYYWRMEDREQESIFISISRNYLKDPSMGRKEAETR